MQYPIQSISSQSKLSKIFPLLECNDLPSKLYYQGNLDLLQPDQPKIAIVGTRNPSNYANKLIQTLVPEIASAGYTIVSGGAFGVDINTHKVASNFTEKIIVVLGSGLEDWTPKTNKQYFHSFLNNGGAIISPFEPSLKPTKYTFVQRNKYIASMADLVLIVEAGSNSGSLHTALYAAEQGIPVACFPSNVFDEQSQGCNNLIKQGAHLVTCFSEIQDLIPLIRRNNLKHSPKINSKTQNDVFSEINLIINNSLNL